MKVIRTSESFHLSAFSAARSQVKMIVFDLCLGNPNQYSFLSSSSSSSMLTDVSESREKRQDKSIRIPPIGMVIKQMSSWEWTVRRERERERGRERIKMEIGQVSGRVCVEGFVLSFPWINTRLDNGSIFPYHSRKWN